MSEVKQQDAPKVSFVHGYIGQIYDQAKEHDQYHQKQQDQDEQFQGRPGAGKGQHQQEHDGEQQIADRQETGMQPKSVRLHGFTDEVHQRRRLPL
ncbi:MAG TPA: hypothetical protein VEL76_11310 [Gemmataceae bacterium]|nr:hypothetical protein [Gemmataceae bacterium]